MNDFEQVLLEKNYALAAQFLLADEQLLQQTMQEFFTGHYRYNQQLSNVFDCFKTQHQSVLQPFFKQWIELLSTPQTDAFHRNSYRYFQDVEIPEQYQGKLYQFSFAHMLNMSNAIAIRVFAMTTCFNIAKHYVELLPELQQAIQVVREDQSSAVQSRSRHLLTAIQKCLSSN